jgi:hypothetical protein
MVGRPGLPEFPLIMIDAEAKNSGKTRTATAMAHILGSQKTGINNIQRLNQQSGGMAWKPGPNVLLFDNIANKVFSEHLSAAVHEEHLTVEPKHLGMSRIFYPLMIFTLNQGRVEHDLSDKCMFIRLNRPENIDPEGAVIMDPDPQVYAREHRLSILAEIRHILAEARPRTRDSFVPQTRFVDWECALRGIGDVLGYEFDLRRDTEEVRDQLTLDLLNAIEHYQEANTSFSRGDCPAMSDLVHVIRSFPKDYTEANHLLRGVTSDRGRARRLNAAIKKILGKKLTFGGIQYILSYTDDKPTRVRMEEC